MAPDAHRKNKKDEIKVTIGPFRDKADYKACENIQREVWHIQDIDIVPVPLLLAADRAGGILLGAFSNLGELIGFVFSLPGLRNGKPLQHSYMMAVRTAYRNFDVGFKLKIAQHEEALKRKISLIESSFDPMQPLNAYFALGKLGEWSHAYEENYYGEASGIMDRGLPTDRLLTCWSLDSTAVIRRLELGPPHRDCRKELKRRTVINQLLEVAPGLMNSSPVNLNCSADQFLFEVPYNLQEIKNRDLGIALEWQGKMRQVFHHYFKKEYAATDFWVAEQDGHLRAFYLLEKKKL
jgi:predicted GNAT superfamily acetyltransferase